ncbi:TPA: RHS repeat-associated core domain-containing protein [Serratia fonticola]|nr:RHS repeat-associated core domain-containing protein [Serratia fonticola]HBE9093544.1 RHS repeat-associated core domain-containing protein [Serratia fonticola]HBE9151968.1 RHS repeat-associated core domain-containing protein [Serratia fonticola]
MFSTEEVKNTVLIWKVFLNNTACRGQYSAYGQLTEEWTPPDARDEHPQPKVNNPLRFQGQYEDTESGLYYNLNRYYDPGIGRYLTADPVKLDGGLNSYQHVDGNPVGWVDPLGVFKRDATGAERSSVNTGIHSFLKFRGLVLRLKGRLMNLTVVL